MPIFNLFKYFSYDVKQILDKYFSENDNNDYLTLEEIRLRSGRPVIIKLYNDEKVLNHIVTMDDMIETLANICENSIYSYQNQICNGFITVRGGHRVGLSGNVIIENNKIININYISSLNFRIARQIKGCSNKALRYIIDIENKNIYNTIIVSPPGAGKTTLLRDAVRKISNGIDSIAFNGLNIGMIDERGELAAMYKGIAQNDVGMRTDVLSNVPKGIGMKMLIRSMAPKVIVADEIGSEEDVEAINQAVCSGIKGIFTAHGASIEDLMLNPALKELLKTHIFERIIFLSTKLEKGDIDRVYYLNRTTLEYVVLWVI